MDFEVKDFGCYARPQNDMIGRIRDSCNDFSYKFTNGIYFLTGEIDIGAWSFAYSLTDTAKDTHVYYTSLLVNGISVDLDVVRNQTFHVGQYEMYGKKTFESVLKKALKKSKNNRSYDDMLRKFDRFGFDERPIEAEAKRWRMNCVNRKIWYLSPLIGLALGKKIFVFPWLSKKDYLSGFFQMAYDLLVDEDVIVIVPCSEKIQFPTGDKYNVVRMASLFNLFVHDGVDFEKDHR